MNKLQLQRVGGELEEFLDSLLCDVGRPERRRSLENYVIGLLLDGDRKSIEPMAGRLVDDASEIQAMRQRLQECVSVSEWSDSEVLSLLARKLDRELPGLEALVIDDTGFPKKGIHSVGVARQYSGTLGRVDNCQVGVSLHLAGDQTSACIGHSLYLPKEWINDSVRRKKTGVPNEITFREKWRIALDLLDEALAAGVRHHTVLADAGYGDIRDFRDGLEQRGLKYVVAVKGNTVVWGPDAAPRIPPKKRAQGHAPKRWHDDAHPPIAVESLAPTLRFTRVTWREGSKGWQKSKFAAVRIRTAYDHQHATAPGDEQWLLCQWFGNESAPTKFWLSNLPKDTSTRALLRAAKLRWRIERDYQEMKQEIGLDHFEGRSWRGFNHHVTLCAIAHAFLALQRALFPPEETDFHPDVSKNATASAAAPNWSLSIM